MSELALTLSSVQQAERAEAIRRLLRKPLLTAIGDAEALALVVRHRVFLARWFAEQPGWKLSVDPGAGYARLFKVPVAADGRRPAEVPLASSSRPFDSRRYVLLCLLLAVLDDQAGQTTLRTLAERLQELSQDEPEIEPFDPERQSERRAFVDVVRWLVGQGVLVLRDGDEGRFGEAGEGDALYDLEDRLLGLLLSAPQPPSLCADASAMMHEPVADTDEGRRRGARQEVLRRLLDDPVLYTGDLSDEARAWLEPSTGFVLRLLQEDAGFVVERRGEGLAAIDPSGLSTDQHFPAGDSTAKHAALLLAALVASRVREGRSNILEDALLHSWMAELIDTYGQRCGWRADLCEEGAGPGRLLVEVTDLLAGLHLLREVEGGWEARPAIARFAPAPT